MRIMQLNVRATHSGAGPKQADKYSHEYSLSTRQPQFGSCSSGTWLLKGNVKCIWKNWENLMVDLNFLSPCEIYCKL